MVALQSRLRFILLRPLILWGARFESYSCPSVWVLPAV